MLQQVQLSVCQSVHLSHSQGSCMLCPHPTSIGEREGHIDAIACCDYYFDITDHATNKQTQQQMT